MNLYQLTGDYLNFLMLSDEFDEQTFLDTLESIQEPLEMKMANYVKVIRAIESDIEAIKKEEQRLAALKKSKTNTILKLKETLLYSVEVAGKEMPNGNKKLFVQDDPFVKSIYTQNNPPSVEILSEKSIPKKFKVPQPPKIDSKAILAEWKEDKTIKIRGIRVNQSTGVRFN